jgi:TolA-binding protein
LLTLGELRLRQYEMGETNAVPAGNGTVTNRLGQALSAFQSFTNRFPESPLFGKAQLDLGWCLWLEGKLPESQAALQIAVQRLPLSLDQATARFKLGDTLYRQNQFAAALTNYSAILELFPQASEVTNSLFEPTLYQLVRAGIAAGDLPAATNALSKLLAWFPNGFLTDRAVLLTAQEVGVRSPAAARRLLSEFAAHVTGSSLLPELQLAIARTHEQEQQWAEAITLYDSWLARFTNHPAQARAEYSRARANFKADRETNALIQFTSFTARFPTSELAPLARWWLGDFHFRAGDAQAAEENYQAVYQNTNWPITELSYQARMMAGRAAFARQGWKDAKDYFGKLAGNTNCPAPLRAQAFFALGDTLMSQDSTNKLADYQEALSAFDQVFYLCPSNHLAALAWGAKANCLLQWAQTSQDYSSVSNAFQQVISAPGADAQARSIAAVGLGVTLEKLAGKKNGEENAALLNLALREYLDVFYEKLLRENEKPDPFWTRRAGMEAGRLAEAMKLRTQAINVYQRLQELFPPLKFDGKINALKALEKEAGAKY